MQVRISRFMTAGGAVSCPNLLGERMTGREQWGSRFGFIMAAAGSAVGLGNIWRFPYTTGENGGGAFLLIYLAIILGFGLAVVIAEMLIGRAAQKNPVGAFRALGNKGWSAVGFMGVLTGFIITSFYVVVAGWCLAYIGFMASGKLATTNASILQGTFEGFISATGAPLVYAAIFMALVVLVLAGGIGKGIERANKVLMPLLFVLLILLVIRAVTLPGAEEGLRFYLIPNWSEVTVGTFREAVAQAFFSISLGMGTMITYGSYLSLKENVPSSALTVVLLDSAVAILAGLMIIPAVFAAGLNPSAGPGLTFITLPAVFAAMPAGAFFGIVFFLLLSIAALTSAVSILEPMIAYFVDEHRINRRKVVFGVCAVCFALGVPASLSLGIMAGFKIFGLSWFDLMDTLANNFMLPLGGFFTAIFAGWAWGPKAILAMSNNGTLTQSWAPVWLFVVRFVAPISIGWILATNLIG